MSKNSESFEADAGLGLGSHSEQSRRRSREVVYQLLEAVATRLKGVPFRIDPNVPVGYITRLAIERAFMKFRGALKAPRSANVPFVGRGVAIRCRSRIQFGKNVSLGDHAYVDALSLYGVVLGDAVSVGRETRVECTGSVRNLGLGLRVGDRAALGTNCFYGCAGFVSIGADTIVGNFVSFHSENHISDRSDVPISLQGVTRVGIVVGSGCWIGAKATILDGVNIGADSIVAAGAVVTAAAYPDRAILGGVPAKILQIRS